MNAWPEGWFRDEPGRGDGGMGGRAAGSAGGAPSADPSERLPYARRESQPAAAASYSDPTVEVPYGGRGSQPGSTGWPEQPPSHGSGLRGFRGDGGGTGRRGRRALKIIGGLVAVLLVAAVGMYFYLDSKLTRVTALPTFTGQSAGQNWLITGSDSRQGLTAQQEAQLHTGHDITGQRSDTIMVLHIGSGTPTLVSIPRDSYVDIPGYGKNKINAAFSLGGPKLLAQTIEGATGLRIDHYMGIGFGGLVNVVDAVGGVNICVKQPLRDSFSGLNLKPGCQALNGGQALSYVRDRHSFASSDLQRVQDQRTFLKALLQKATSPGVFLNPFAAIPTATNSVGAVQVDQGTHLYQLIKVAFALRGPQTTTVPVADTAFPTPAGDAVLWSHAEALQLFNALVSDQPIPKNLLTGTSGA